MLKLTHILLKLSSIHSNCLKLRDIKGFAIVYHCWHTVIIKSRLVLVSCYHVWVLYRSTLPFASTQGELLPPPCPCYAAALQVPGWCPISNCVMEWTQINPARAFNCFIWLNKKNINKN